MFEFFFTNNLCRVRRQNSKAQLNQIPGLCSWLPGAVDGDLDGLVVRRHEVRVAVDRDGHGEALAAAAPADEAQVAEFGHLAGKI